ncbi:TetR/AcrR family transcriptional regulator [Sneathiella marina]|uniref:TetR/AcrR family transcriptional regulator n=1 Tax=Sneathiella marina TaxID=2950108 RepID=A0ABY4VX83_9PROT|nr:TetR/AcrR family transcriptional regulator [Sneathiella marina]USG59547.1 TetR/AcrR family transcriptional regulator [Sneathiella marina]
MSTRDKIANSALELFEQKGVDATSVADICVHAKISNGSFFHAFQSRQDLFKTLYLSALMSYHTAMCAALGPEIGGEKGLANLIQTHIEWVIYNTKQARFLFEQSTEDWWKGEEIRQELERENAQFAQSIAQWRIHLTKKRVLRDVDGKVFFAQVIGPAQIFCRSWLSGRSKSNPLDHCNELIECAQSALVVKTP